MKSETRFEKSGRFLKKIRPFFLFLVFGPIVALADESIEARINRGAFPLARYVGRYESVPRAVEAEIHRQMDQMLAPVRVAPASWFQASFGAVPPSIDRKRIIESVLETDIWKCIGGQCGCAGDEPLGCVKVGKAMGGVGVVALIHPCLIGEGACPRGAKPDTNAWLEKIVPTIAFYKAGFKDTNDALNKAKKASSKWIASTSASVNRILGACPGPYSIDSKKFLLMLDSITDPNPALRKCGEKYLSELRDLPTKCPKLRSVMNEEWTAFSKANLAVSPEIYRCDAYCRKLLCRTVSAKTIFTSFSGKSALLLADGACEGESPRDVPGMLRGALPRALRSRLESYGCLPKGETPEEDSIGNLPNGPDVQLVE